jgi:DNA polymerase-4
VAGNKLVSKVAAQVAAPDGDLLEVSAGSEMSFLAPLPVTLLPAARAVPTASRLDLLNVRFVREVQSLSLPHLTGAFGRDGLALWSEARGVDPSPVRAPEQKLRVLAEETLAQETNDSRALAAHAARLACEVAAGLRARHEGAQGLVLAVEYADGEEGIAQRTFDAAHRGSAALIAAAEALLGRAVKRRVRVRRMRLSAWGMASTAAQLDLWADTEIPRAASLESVIDRARDRFGPEALVPATWMLHGLVLRASPRS